MQLSQLASYNSFSGGKDPAAVRYVLSFASGTSVSTETGTVNVTLEGGSTWTLTGDSYVTSFTGDASNVISNGYTLYVNGVALTGTK